MAFDALILSKCFRLLQDIQCIKTNVYSNARKKILLLMWFFAHHCSVAVMLAEVTEVAHMQIIEINPQIWDSFSFAIKCLLFLTSHTWCSDSFEQESVRVFRNCIVVCR